MGLSYGTKEEYNFRFQIFKETDERLEKINARETDFEVGHNKFSTMTKAERRKVLGRKKRTGARTMEKVQFLDAQNLPSSIDWVQKGAVNPVQDQGQCGSCWAFSSTAAMEGAHFLKTGKLKKLSESNFVDCDPKSDGCDGGLEIYAFQYAEKHAQEDEKDYPYRASTRHCAWKKSLGDVLAENYHEVPKKSVSQLKAAIAKQPTCVSVDAEDDQFMFYKKGILTTKTCGTDLDHAVTAVGYGSENGKGYFKVRNSWGPSWGEHGYIRMSSDVGGAGVCGVLLDSSRPDTD